nr:Serine/threonine-protein phosphatase 7 long form-like [Ipomoea batatas]
MLNREKHKYRAHFRRHDDVQGLYSVAIEGSVNASGRPNYVGVNINERVCNCGQWSVDGLSCVHAHAACHYVSRVADGFVPEKFAISKYIFCYEGIIMPLLEEEYWPPTTFHYFPPDVSVVVNRPGRCQMSRIPNEMDLDNRRCAKAATTLTAGCQARDSRLSVSWQPADPAGHSYFLRSSYFFLLVEKAVLDSDFERVDVSRLASLDGHDSDSVVFDRPDSDSVVLNTMNSLGG